MRDAARASVRFLPLVAVTTVLAWWSTSAIRARTGEPSVPLDDAYIHFTYARSLSQGHPLVYSPGDPETSGATSLLWSSVLAPFWKVGLRDTAIIWAAWLIGFVCLALLALETRRLAARLLPRGTAVAAGAMVLSFGGHVWCAGSGMEVLPFAWLLLRTARLAAEVHEAHFDPSDRDHPTLPEIDLRRPFEALARDDVDPPTRRELRRLALELSICAALLPFARPEGVVVALFAAVTLFRVGARRAAIGPVAAVAAMFLLLRVATGSFTSTTARAKWLILDPYTDRRAFFEHTLTNVHVLFTQLLDGKGPARAFLPDGFFYAVVLAVPALLFAVRRRGHAHRAACIAIVAMCIMIPATYESFLANRLRYLWPFTAAWMIALAAIGDAAATIATRLDKKLESLRVIIPGIIAAAMAGQLAASVEDLAVSAAGIHDQQVALARWARDALPAGALVGVNDAGAIAYLGGKRTFDIVGLTTRDEARYWVAGPGSRFEHYERRAREGGALPSHLVVYPQWFEISPILGTKLNERTVEGATVLGAPTMVAHEAAWSPWVGTGELPTNAPGALIDALDVADLESEAEHGYELGPTSRGENGLILNEQRIDGARLGRSFDRFALRLAPGGRLWMRIGTTLPAAFARVRIDGTDAKQLELRPDPWQELAIDLPPTLTDGAHRIEVEAAPGQPFVSMHYWSYR